MAVLTADNSAVLAVVAVPFPGHDARIAVPVALTPGGPGIPLYKRKVWSNISGFDFSTKHLVLNFTSMLL